MTTTNNKPTHEVHHVTGEGDKARWTRIGAAWTHKDGNGFNLALNYLPLTQDGHLVVRKVKPKQEAK